MFLKSFSFSSHKMSWMKNVDKNSFFFDFFPESGSREACCWTCSIRKLENVASTLPARSSTVNYWSYWGDRVWERSICRGRYWRVFVEVTLNTLYFCRNILKIYSKLKNFKRKKNLQNNNANVACSRLNILYCWLLSWFI